MEAKNPEGEDTFYFLDSPYLENKAAYKHNMTSPKEHKAYCEALRKLKGAVMACGYDEERYKLYDDILEPFLGSGSFHRINEVEAFLICRSQEIGRTTRGTQQ